MTTATSTRDRDEPDTQRLSPVTVLLGVLSAALVVEAVLSVWWGMELDSPDLSYLAFMIDRLGRIPYAGTFDPSAPGALLFHLAIGKTVGYGELAFGIVGFVWLAALLVATWRLMRLIDRRVAWAACVITGLAYLQHGRTMTLQRDWVATLPIVVACVLAANSNRGSAATRAAIIGLLFGCAATMKPQLAVGLPVAVVYLLVEDANADDAKDVSARPGRIRRLSGVALAGFAVPVAGALAWVAASGGWSAFVDYYTNYLPLYLHLDANHHAMTGSQRWLYLIEGVISLGGLWLWVLPAAVGAYSTVVGRGLPARQRRLVILLAALSFVYALEPALAGQFFDYHWMPFQHFLLCTAAVVLLRPLVLPSGSTAPRWFGSLLFTIVAVLALHPAPEAVDQIRDHHVPPAEQGRAKEVSEFLRAHLRAGDTVQPLDWVDGAEHGMLLARAPIATRFVHEYQFFHDVANPEIQGVRSEFINDLNHSRPRYLIDVYAARPYVTGPGTSDTFPELDALIATHYHPVFEGTGVTIYERNSNW